MDIRLLTTKGGEVRVDAKAKPNTWLGTVVLLAECMVNDGYADYAIVTVNGRKYAEYYA